MSHLKSHKESSRGISLLNRLLGGRSGSTDRSETVTSESEDGQFPWARDGREGARAHAPCFARVLAQPQDSRLGGISRRQLLKILRFKCVRSRGPAQPRNRMFSLDYFNYFSAETSTVNDTKPVPRLRRRVSVSLGVRRIEGNSEQLFSFCLGNKTSHT